jgi:hypothetical protein
MTRATTIVRHHALAHDKEGLPVQLNVIPAKAGIHAIYRSTRSWIPAFAGMTI